MADAQQQTLLSRAADGSATEEQRRDALTALQGQLSGGAEEDGGGVGAAACLEVATGCLAEDGAPAAVVRCAIWLLAHAHPAQAALLPAAAEAVQPLIGSRLPRLRAAAHSALAWLVNRHGLGLPPALLADCVTVGLGDGAAAVRLAALELVDAGAKASSAAGAGDTALQALARAVVPVAAMLADASVEVRVAAANALARLRCVECGLSAERWLALLVIPPAAADGGSAAGEGEEEGLMQSWEVRRPLPLRSVSLLLRAQGCAYSGRGGEWRRQRNVPQAAAAHEAVRGSGAGGRRDGKGEGGCQRRRHDRLAAPAGRFRRGRGERSGRGGGDRGGAGAGRGP